MATLSISLSGSSVVTGTKNYTVSDADLQLVLNWAQAAFNPYIQATFNPGNTPGFVPTNQQILLAWVQSSWIDRTKAEVRAFNTPTPTVPSPVVFT